MSMKKIHVAMCVVAAMGISAVASDALVEKAKKAGLKPIPESKTELYKLIDNAKNPITDEKIELGKKLYFDPRLSKSGLISCNTCHNLATGGVDGVDAATGHKWTANPHHLNSPTVYNAVFMEKQFWDGRSPDLEDQAQGPIQAAPEMAATKEHVVSVVNSIPDYVKAFKHAYNDPKFKPGFKDVADVIAIFERTLVTPSRYDEYLNGCDKALSKEEKEGLKIFIDKGCTACHTGVGLGGSMQPFPAVGKYKYANVGDFKGDKNGMVKTPTLRNILETRPYFHNGAVWNIEEAIKIMGETQLGVKISDREAKKIKAFFGALTGKKPYVRYPMLPASTDKTPNPNLK
ncbi:cytochrome-c peroxidase [Hydrogenimonas sp.]|uniref:cytochrome-c peroxidase n=1 Tax=Hydrogenimonas sp. TaxID=2231112 RepID=UPI00262D5190|nr:cytochrome-c peroxidase [Hydrogenimonas sp.]